MSVQVAFTTPGRHRWTCPDRVTSVDVEAEGGTSNDGNPGETIRATLPVTPGVTYDLTVGDGCISLSGSVTYEGAVTTGTGGGGGGGIPVPGHITLTYDEG